MPLLSGEEPNLNGDGQSSIFTLKSHGNPSKFRADIRRLRHAVGVEWNPRSCGDRAFEPEKPGEAQRVEATWACSCPASCLRLDASTERACASGRRAHDARRSSHISVARPRRRSTWLARARGGIYVDATFGAGGYSRAILDDRGNPRASASTATARPSPAGSTWSTASDGRLTLVEDRFSNLADVCAAQGATAVDGVVMDVGVSSMQLDQAERGFSFRLDGPLDMRMGQDGLTAADVVAKASEADLANIIYIFGEERHLRAVARAIVAARKEAPIDDDEAAGRYRRQGGAQPSRTRSIRRRARSRRLRIFVNAELDELQQALAAAERVLKPGGRLVGGLVPFAGRPHRQEFPRLSAARPAAARGICRRSRRPRRASQILTKRPVTAGRRGGRGQSARALREAARRRAHRRRRRMDAGSIAGLADARRRDEGRLTMRIIHLSRHRRAGLRGGLCLPHQDGIHRAHRERAAAARRYPRAARRHRGAARGMGQAGCADAAAGAGRAPSQLQPIDGHSNTTTLKNLPERPPSFARPGEPDPIGAMINTIDAARCTVVTGSVPAPEDPQ